MSLKDPDQCLSYCEECREQESIQAHSFLEEFYLITFGVFTKEKKEAN